MPWSLSNNKSVPNSICYHRLNNVRQEEEEEGERRKKEEEE